MSGQAWLNGGTFAHGAAGPPMVYFSAYSSGSGQVTAAGPTTARFTVPPVSVESGCGAVNLIKHLGNEEWTEDAMAHKMIIDRFGRFPHRNAVLNRLSTEDEVAHLKAAMRSF